MAKLRHVRYLSRQELEGALTRIQDALYRRDDGVVDEDKEWSGDTFEEIKQALEVAGLGPTG
jgi:hypothetical protein